MSSFKPGEGDIPEARKKKKKSSARSSKESVNNTQNGMESSGSPHAPSQRDRYEALNEHLANLHQSKKTQTNSDRLKKSLNVESPSFTPSTLSVPNKTSAISSQAANAAPFTPRSMTSGTATPNTQPDAQPTFNPAQIREFTPQHYDLSDAVSCLLHSFTFHIIRSARNYTHHSLLTTS
jgi:PAB-dependent poly(A)-specific ribonuclease subunit 3